MAQLIIVLAERKTMDHSLVCKMDRNVCKMDRWIEVISSLDCKPHEMMKKKSRGCTLKSHMSHFSSISSPPYLAGRLS